MEFFNSAIEVLQTLVVALGAGLGVWGGVNLLEGYGQDNPGAKSAGFNAEKIRRGYSGCNGTHRKLLATFGADAEMLC